jgi:Tfp pilus assembly protein PilO
MFVVAAVLIFSLFGWNIYLMDEVEELRKTEKELQLKNQMLEGDNDVLSYDLVTCRDSLRILNEQVKIEKE